MQSTPFKSRLQNSDWKTPPSNAPKGSRSFPCVAFALWKTPANTDCKPSNSLWQASLAAWRCCSLCFAPRPRSALWQFERHSDSRGNRHTRATGRWRQPPSTRSESSQRAMVPGKYFLLCSSLFSSLSLADHVRCPLVACSLPFSPAKTGLHPQTKPTPPE
jgi:hypothetical protein